MNLKSTPDALPYFVSDANIALFSHHGVLTESEVRSRYEITLENYCKVLNIEAETMLEMAKRDILPAVTAYTKELTETALSKRALNEAISCQTEIALIEKLSALSASMYEKIGALEEALLQSKQIEDVAACSMFYKESVFAAMQELRAVADELESLTAKTCWPFPTYGDLLFSVC